MASMDYETIFNNFVGDMTDYSLASLSISDAYGLMVEWLHKAVARPYIRNLFSSIALDDDVQELTYTMAYPVDEDSDYEFIAMMFGKQMVYEWLHSKVFSTTNSAQFFGGKEQKYYSQAAHMAELRGMQQDALNNVRKMIRDRGFIWNNYLEG